MDATQDRPRHARASWLQQLAKRLLGGSTQTRRTNRGAHPNLEVLEQHVLLTAFGWQDWPATTVNVCGGQGGITVCKDVDIPGGRLYHETVGSGLHVSREVGNFYALKPICNWRIDFVYRDLGDQGQHVWWRNTGPLQSNCKFSGLRRFDYPGTENNVLPGKTCAQLFAEGKFVAQQCHNLTRS